MNAHFIKHLTSPGSQILLDFRRALWHSDGITVYWRDEAHHKSAVAIRALIVAEIGFMRR